MRYWAWCLAVLWLPAVAGGEEPKIDKVELTLKPAAAVRPYLRYRLLPDYVEQTSGNAVPLYYKAFLLYEQNKPHKDLAEKIPKWLEMPLAELPRKEVAEALSSRSAALKLVAIAARRNQCQWDDPIREEENVFAIMLPELQLARNLGRLVALEARLRLAEGKFDAALVHLQTGYAMARHVAEQQFLISGLVATSIATMMNQQLETLVAQPGAPNLFWALRQLPTPLISFDRCWEVEAATIQLLFPQYDRLKRRGGTPAQWQEALSGMVGRSNLLSSMAGGSTSDDLSKSMATVALGAMALASVPTAEPELRELGFTADQIKAMSPPQIALTLWMETYFAYRDNLFRWFNMPYAEAIAGFRAAEEDLKKVKNQTNLGAIFAKMMLPALGSVRTNQARLDRQVAGLMVIEAVRMHAAAEGKLPTTLAEVKCVPLPTNPMTGKPFSYRLEAGAAVLLLDGGPASTVARQYRITLAK